MTTSFNEEFKDYELLGDAAIGIERYEIRLLASRWMRLDGTSDAETALSLGREVLEENVAQIQMSSPKRLEIDRYVSSIDATALLRIQPKYLDGIEICDDRTVSLFQVERKLQDIISIVEYTAYSNL